MSDERTFGMDELMRAHGYDGDPEEFDDWLAERARKEMERLSLRTDDEYAAYLRGRGDADDAARAHKPRWQSFLPEPFWPTLAALLMLSVITAIPLAVVCALLWGSVTGLGATTMLAGCYLAAIPITWWLFRQRAH